MKINLKDFIKELGTIQNLILTKTKITLLRKIYIFSYLPIYQLEKLSERLKIEVYNKGEIIIEENKSLNKLIIVKSGEVYLFRESKIIKTLKTENFIGERSLFFPYLSPKIVSKGNVVLLTLCKDDFEEFLSYNETLNNFLIQSIYFSNKMELNEFSVIGLITHDDISKTYKVKNLKNDNNFSIVTIHKKKALSIIKTINQEREITVNLNHPFILKISETYEDENFIYYLTENCLFKSLSFLIADNQMKINKDLIIFIMSSLILSLEYLHKNRVIYRGINLENVCITNKGLIKLINFRNSKVIKDFTNTFLSNNIHYSCPEVILGKNYSFYSDLWSLGVLLYEFIFQKFPFCENESDPLQIYKSILIEEVSFPYDYDDEDLQDIIMKLLEKNLVDRLINLESVKSHKWFYNFKWVNLI